MLQLNELIRTITPYYNEYKENKNLIDGKDSIIIMWDIGNLLKEYTDKNNIAPHNLFRKIYGKSEGKDNISQKSYITREFLGRCFRIKAIFKSKIDVELLLPNLKDFSSFREAMPFFDNPKYVLEKKDWDDLLKLLNSKKSSTMIVKELESKKKSINNIKNPRTQKLQELELEKQSLIDFYNLTFRLLKAGDYKSAIKNIGIEDPEVFNILSKNISALAQEGILKYPMPNIEINNAIVNSFYQILKILLTPKDEKIRRRFRRLISPERIIRLAEMIYCFTSENQFLK